jgi:uncharacterized protein with LGFP repeats
MKLLYRGIAFTVAALVGLTLLPPEAEANQRRRPNPQAMRRQQEAMKKAQAQMKAYQEDVLRYQREMAAKNEEIVKRFDANGDGKLLGPEKSKYDKYMIDVQKGKEQNPFAEIMPPGQGIPATGN